MYSKKFTMEKKSRSVLMREIKRLNSIERRDLQFEGVANRQIISALLREMSLYTKQEGYLYEVLQGVANEARRRGLLINPNPYARETYSTAVGNTNRMMPSMQGWEQTKGILSRHITQAQLYLTKQLLGRTP